MKPYKRYMVFEASEYYPAKWPECVADSFDTLEEAIEYGKQLIRVHGREYVAVFDRIDGEEKWTF